MSNIRMDGRRIYAIGTQVMILVFSVLTVQTAFCWRGTCSSSDEDSLSESDAVAKKRLILVLGKMQYAPHNHLTSIRIRRWRRQNWQKWKQQSWQKKDKLFARKLFLLKLLLFFELCFFFLDKQIDRQVDYVTKKLNSVSKIPQMWLYTYIKNTI